MMSHRDLYSAKIDLDKCFQQAFDRSSKSRKPMFRAVQHIFGLAETRGFLKAERMIQELQRRSPKESSDEIRAQWLAELYEFVSPDECAVLIKELRNL